MGTEKGDQRKRKNAPGRRFTTTDGGGGQTAVFDGERNERVSSYDQPSDAKAEAKRLNDLDRAGQVPL